MDLFLTCEEFFKSFYFVMFKLLDNNNTYSESIVK